MLLAFLDSVAVARLPVVRSAIEQVVHITHQILEFERACPAQRRLGATEVRPLDGASQSIECAESIVQCSAQFDKIRTVALEELGVAVYRAGGHDDAVEGLERRCE